MTDALLSNEVLVRLTAFASFLAAMVAWEVLAPRRIQQVGRIRRWPGNLAVVTLDTVLVRVLFPVTAVGLALVLEVQGLGLFNALAVSPWVAVTLGVVLLDRAIYFQHVLLHAVPVFWRLHRMHH